MTTSVNTAPTLSPWRSGAVNPQYGVGDSGVFVMPDGRIVLGWGAALSRLHADGSADDFGPPYSGYALVNVTVNGKAVFPQFDHAFAMASNGSLLAAGALPNTGASFYESSIALASLSSSGILDTRFGKAGVAVVTPVAGAHNTVAATVALADGKILIGGTTVQLNAQGGDKEHDGHAVLIRLLADGTPDPSFGVGGVQIDAVDGFHTKQVLVQTDGKIVCLGSLDISNRFGIEIAGVLRFNADGTRDMTFGSSGFAAIQSRFSYSAWFEAHSMELTADGKLLITGMVPDPDFVLSAGVFRLNANGSPDASFGHSGEVVRFLGIDGAAPLAVGLPDYSISEGSFVHTLADGKIFVVASTAASTGGKTNYQIELMRLNADGSLDVGFGKGGALSLPLRQGSGFITEGSTLTSDGDVVLSGLTLFDQRTDGNRSPVYTVVRIHPDGTFDQDFGSADQTQDAALTTVQGAPAQPLLPALTVADTQLALSNYAGASLTITRTDAGNLDGHFTSVGDVSLTSGVLSVAGVVIATVSETAGKIGFAFNAKATQALVNTAVRALVYDYTGKIAGSVDIKLKWVLDDGNQGAQGSGGPLSTTLATSVTIKALDVPYWIDSLLDHPAGMTAAAYRAQMAQIFNSDFRLGLAFDGAVGSPTKGWATEALAQITAATAIHLDGAGPGLVLHPRADLAGSLVAGPLTARGADLYFTADAAGGNGVTALSVGLEHVLGVKADTDGIDMLDIATLQYLYGVNPAARAGNDTYQLDAAKANFIWDGNGTDTISAAGIKQGVTLHLDPGNWDYIGAKGAAITAAGQVTINYGTQIENAIGGSGNDTFYGNALANVIDGGAGTDTVVFDKAHTAYAVKASGADWLVDNDTLRSIEQLRFSDGYFSFDTAGNAGQVYRIYQAVFGRAPDADGQGFWTGQMDKGLSLAGVAGFFIDSPEFAQRFGSKVSNEAFITNLYANVLHRAPDSGGMDFWKGLLDAGTITQAGALTGFSQSPENIAQLVGTMQAGMAYVPFHA